MGVANQVMVGYDLEEGLPAVRYPTMEGYKDKPLAELTCDVCGQHYRRSEPGIDTMPILVAIPTTRQLLRIVCAVCIRDHRAVVLARGASQ